MKMCLRFKITPTTVDGNSRKLRFDLFDEFWAEKLRQRRDA